MSIRTRLLSLLLPTVIVYFILISIFFYYNWYCEITKSFRSNLKSITVSVAENIDPQDIAWLNQNIHAPFYKSSPLYQKYVKKFLDIQDRLPVDNLYIVKIEPVRKGEPVVLDRPQSETNKAYDGSDDQYAYRQVILVETDFSAVTNLYDFAESNENSVYFTKKPLVTPIYESKSSLKRFMTGFAPIIDFNEQVVGLVAADVNLDIFDRIQKNALLVIVISSLVALCLIAGSIYLIANRISKPVQQLNNAALGLAAGDYEGKIHVEGPKEIVELANTLNTMRECLLENISQLRDSSLLRERLYGEYECSLLLQQYMLTVPLEKIHDPRIEVKHIQYTAKKPQGLLLDVQTLNPKSTVIVMQEAVNEGFEGMTQLLKSSLKEPLNHPFVKVVIDYQKQSLSYSNQFLPPPLVWSTKENKLISEQNNEFPLQPGDYFFLFNQGFASQLHHPPYLKEWFSKVLRHFSKESFDLLTAMFISELNFMTKKQPIQQDLHILCFHMKQE